MTSNKNHPGRSHEFLSRLHDGDLSPAERAHFEAHRAHCRECRSAAADFERALSLFRSSRSSPPPADLANRVLRKVQSIGASRRTPFGDLFSVDLRWAGAFAAALLVLLVAAPIVLRQENKPAAPPDGPIAVALQNQSRENLPKGDAASAPAPAAEAPARQRQEAERNARVSQAAPAAPKQAPDPPSVGFANEPQSTADDKATGKVAAAEAAAAKPVPEVKLEAAQAAAPAAPASTLARRAGAVPGKGQAPMAQAASASEAQGGEGARDQVTLSAGSPVLDRPARIVVQPVDAQGAPPELRARPPDPALNDLRGRSFVVLIDEQGRVLEAREAASKNALGIQKRSDEELAKEKDSTLSGPASDALKTLRFKPGERKRRVILRIE